MGWKGRLNSKAGKNTFVEEFLGHGNSFEVESILSNFNATKLGVCLAYTIPTSSAPNHYHKFPTSAQRCDVI